MAGAPRHDVDITHVGSTLISVIRFRSITAFSLNRTVLYWRIRYLLPHLLSYLYTSEVEHCRVQYQYLDREATGKRLGKVSYDRGRQVSNLGGSGMCDGYHKNTLFWIH